MSSRQLEQGLMRLGREAARVRDAQVAARLDRAAKDAFESAWRARRAMRRSRAFPIGRFALVAAALFAAAAAMVLRLRPQTLTFTVRQARGEVGAWIAPSEDVPLHFSDGTNVLLAGDSLARITELREKGAEIEISQGMMHASVVHQSGARWTMHVGPFVVRVTGTKFDAGWDAQTRLFTLQLREGAVIVTGCGTEPRELGAGMSLHLLCAQGDADSSTVPPVPAVPSKAEQDVRELVVSPEARIDASAPPKPPAVPLEKPAPAIAAFESAAPLPEAGSAVADDAPAPPPSWRALASEGRSREALAAALTRFDDECQTASSSDVMTLADVARFAGDTDRARAALRTVRSRFPHTQDSARAAFILGRLDFDGDRLEDAARWFQVALAEDPTGSLAREAEGRLLEARNRAGDREGARAAAQLYLERYPSGPYAPLALRVLGEK